MPDDERLRSWFEVTPASLESILGPWMMDAVRATLHPDTPAALELLIARTRVLDYL